MDSHNSLASHLPLAPFPAPWGWTLLPIPGSAHPALKGGVPWVLVCPPCQAVLLPTPTSIAQKDHFHVVLQVLHHLPVGILVSSTGR